MIINRATCNSRRSHSPDYKGKNRDSKNRSKTSKRRSDCKTERQRERKRLKQQSEMTGQPKAPKQNRPDPNEELSKIYNTLNKLQEDASKTSGQLNLQVDINSLMRDLNNLTPGQQIRLIPELVDTILVIGNPKKPKPDETRNSLIELVSNLNSILKIYRNPSKAVIATLLAKLESQKQRLSLSFINLIAEGLTKLVNSSQDGLSPQSFINGTFLLQKLSPKSAKDFYKALRHRFTDVNIQRLEYSQFCHYISNLRHAPPVVIVKELAQLQGKVRSLINMDKLRPLIKTLDTFEVVKEDLEFLVPEVMEHIVTASPHKDLKLQHYPPLLRQLALNPKKYAQTSESLLTKLIDHLSQNSLSLVTPVGQVLACAKWLDILEYKISKMQDVNEEEKNNLQELVNKTCKQFSEHFNLQKIIEETSDQFKSKVEATVAKHAKLIFDKATYQGESLEGTPVLGNQYIGTIDTDIYVPQLKLNIEYHFTGRRPRRKFDQLRDNYLKDEHGIKTLRINQEDMPEEVQANEFKRSQYIGDAIKEFLQVNYQGQISLSS